MMKILFWNIRAGGGRRVDEIIQQIEQWQPDLVSLAEFRGTPASTHLRQYLAQHGWPHQLHTINPDKLAMNALLLASRYPLHPLNLPNAPTEPCRWLMAKVDCPTPLSIGVMHVPNRVTGRKYPYHDAVLDVIRQWSLGPALLVGDTNTGLPELDGTTDTFTKAEISWMETLETLKWHDTLRYLYGDKRVYTWYSHKNNGFRLDEAFINPELMPRLHDIDHLWGVSPSNPERRDALSDHSAILLTLGD